MLISSIITIQSVTKVKVLHPFIPIQLPLLHSVYNTAWWLLLIIYNLRGVRISPINICYVKDTILTDTLQKSNSILPLKGCVIWKKVALLISTDIKETFNISTNVIRYEEWKLSTVYFRLPSLGQTCTCGSCESSITLTNLCTTTVWIFHTHSVICITRWVTY